MENDQKKEQNKEYELMILKKAEEMVDNFQNQNRFDDKSMIRLLQDVITKIKKREETKKDVSGDGVLSPML